MKLYQKTRFPNKALPCEKKLVTIYPLALAFLMSCMAFGLGACELEKEPLKIGLAINLSGRDGTSGEHIRTGAMLAVEQINVSGGINGQPLRLLVRDDANTTEGVQKAAEALIKENVAAIFGHSTSSNTLKAYSYLASKNTLLITAYTATTKLTAKDDLFFRTSVDCLLYAKKMAALLKKKNIESIAVLMDMANPDFVLDYINLVSKFYPGVITRVQFESRKMADWNELTQTLIVDQPDAILLLTDAMSTGIALQKIRATDFNGALIGTSWAQSPELVRVAGAAADGIALVSYIDPNNQRPAYRQFSKAIKARFTQPANARSARAYELVHILATALINRKESTPQALKTALLQGEYETLLGQVKFDPFGDVVRPVYEIIIQDGRFHKIAEIK